ncbi:tRNA adenosine deaminase-associated protein [Nocardioides bruguierae]|uniref:tRNA adenosine deaminase-associated protein n=1 Tax=Nocardioides bruguierae TaxID=2945102 RepID=UPI00201FD21B|nr:tRNA adenosine deaminase-associated protein [Nocardioides bruguierae]MCL8025458.1 tRNA adenosine deaminase-associated protein [Nocardioides bruguierae]
MSDDLGEVDVALVAYREDGWWTVAELAEDDLEDVEDVADALSEMGTDAVAMIAVADEFFVLVRVAGPETRVLLSDGSAAEDYDLAASVLDFLDVDDQDDDDLGDPVGHLDVLGDLGIGAPEMEDLLDDTADAEYLDEVLSDLARRLGFGELFDDAVGLSPA